MVYVGFSDGIQLFLSRVVVLVSSWTNVADVHRSHEHGEAQFTRVLAQCRSDVVIVRYVQQY